VSLGYVDNPFTKSPDDFLRSWMKGGSYPYTDADVANISRITGVKQVLRECIVFTHFVPNATVLASWRSVRIKQGDPNPGKPQGWVVAVDSDVMNVGLVPYFSISDGRFLESTDVNAMLVDETTAKELYIHAGQDIMVGIAGKDVTHTIVGVYNEFSLDPIATSDSYGWYSTMMGLTHFYSYFPPNDTNRVYSSLFVKLTDPSYADSVKESLSKMYPLSPISINRTMDATLSQQLSLTLGTSSLINNVILVASIAGIGVVSMIDLLKRRRELGLYTAIGWRDRDILVRLLRRSLLLGIAGAAVGLVLAFAIGGQVSNALISGQVRFVVGAIQIPEPGLMPYALVMALGLSILSFAIGYLYYRRMTPLRMLEE
jgi:ABC-type antimicrobial peptide transport system permease subunit